MANKLVPLINDTPGTPIELNDIRIETDNPSDGDMLSYNSVSGKFENTPLDTALSETSTNAVQNKAINVLTRKLWEKVDVVSRIGDEYPARNNYIASSGTYAGQWRTSTSYRHWIIPVDGMRLVTVTANSGTDTYPAFLKSYTAGETGTPDYATGYTVPVRVQAGTTVDFVVPADAKYLYLNTGQNEAAKPDHVYLTGVGVTEHTGTSSQFVKADGSIDSNVYLTSATESHDIFRCQYVYASSIGEMQDGVTAQDIINANSAGKTVICELISDLNTSSTTDVVMLLTSVDGGPEFSGTVVKNGQTLLYVLKYDNGEDDWTIQTVSLGQSVLPPISGHAGDVLSVNASETDVEWVTPQGGGGSTTVTSVIPSGTVSGTASISKSVTINGINALTNGLLIRVKNNSSQSASGVTLNLNSLGAKPIYYYRNGSVTQMTNEWPASITYLMSYSTLNTSSGRWDVIGRVPRNSEQGFGIYYCTNTSSDRAWTATNSSDSYSYKLVMHGYVSVRFANAMPAGRTLNIDGTGAKSIYYRGREITADVIKAEDIATFVYDGTNYVLVSIDRWGADIDDIEDSLDNIEESLSTVATSNDYEDLDNKPIVKVYYDGITHGIYDADGTIMTPLQLYNIAQGGKFIVCYIDELDVRDNPTILTVSADVFMVTAMLFTGITRDSIVKLWNNSNDANDWELEYLRITPEDEIVQNVYNLNILNTSFLPILHKGSGSENLYHIETEDEVYNSSEQINQTVQPCETLIDNSNGSSDIIVAVVRTTSVEPIYWKIYTNDTDWDKVPARAAKMYRVRKIGQTESGVREIYVETQSLNVFSSPQQQS